MRLRLFIILVIVTSLISACSSVRVKEVKTKQSEIPYAINVSSRIPHAEYERQLISKLIVYELGKANWILRTTQENIDGNSDNPCSEKIGNIVHIDVVIDDIAGISDTGNAFGGKVEGKGYIKISLAIKDKDKNELKRYSIEADGYTEEFAGLKLAKVGAITIKEIAGKISDVLLKDTENFSCW
ncbi:MAG: hypothetical protein IBX72_11305 [Nitrospirae bacterium]|nr:hypothetical protein [Nitrospirota bacterium]